MTVTELVNHQKNTISIENKIIELLDSLSENPASIELQSMLRESSRHLVESNRTFRRTSIEVDI